MRGLRIDRHGIDEVDVDHDAMFSGDLVWGTLPFDHQHDIWFDDEGLFKPQICVATIGAHKRVPLPVVILGVEGESTVAATVPFDAVESVIGDRVEIG